ncbi:MAG: hypothetical protein JSV89_18995 [Spirochaetaceae bacterium]|nr:MAG: hypothetical protein JSV89_18995 [Spirochaetaceae bacterium]
MRAPKLVCICIILTAGIIAFSWADQVRGLVVEEVQIPSDAAFEHTVALSLEEAAVISLEGETPFLEGIRIELLLSNELKKHFDTYALAIYKNLSPRPTEQVRFYTGDRAFFQYLPYLNRIYILVPLSSPQIEEALPVGTYRLEHPVQRNDFPLLLTMIPLAKGIPATIADKKFYFSIKPLLARKGFVTLTLHFPDGLEGETVSLFVDGAQITAPAERLELSSGIHQLRVVSSSFKEINTSFTVESGKTSLVDIDLEVTISQLSIDAPLGAELYLDGEKISETVSFPIPISEGDHLVRAKIADHSVSKKFNVQKGKHYHLSIIFDIIINED